MINVNEFVKAFEALQEAKNIPAETIIEALKQTLIMAYQQKVGENNTEAMARVDIDEKSGNIHFYVQRSIVEKEDENFNEVNMITLEEAKKVKEDAEVGGIIENEISIDGFQRAAVTYIKQNLRQRLREAEKKMIQETFASKVDDIITGEVERVEPKFVLVNLGITTAFMPLRQQIPGETYYPGQQLKVYIKSIGQDRMSGQNSQIVVSRSDSGLLYRLLEKEIAEIYSGEIKVEKIARIPGERSKVAVYSETPNVDAAGACIGQRGMRIQSISMQLHNEKVDVIQYYDVPELFIAEALKPAIVTGVVLNEEEKSATAIVANDDFSQAIGKKGQNVSLAAKITGYRIDIKTVDEAMTLHLSYRSIRDLQTEYAAANNLEPVSEIETNEEVYEEYNEPVEETVSKAKEETVVKEEPVVNKVNQDIEDVVDLFDSLPIPNIKGEHISVVEEAKPVVEEKPVAKPQGKSNKAKKREEEAKAKEKEEEARKNYMPIYTEEELKAIKEEEEALEEEDKYDDDYDDDYDEYYD